MTIFGEYFMNLKAFLSFNRMDVGWSHMFHVYFSSYFLQVKKKIYFCKNSNLFENLLLTVNHFWFKLPWITKYIYFELDQFSLFSLQCNPPIERFCRNINAENPSWFGKECPYCLPKGEWEDKFLKLFFLTCKFAF